MKNITLGIDYEKHIQNFKNRDIKFHIIKYQQSCNNNLTLLISKVSEAILPNTFNNHIGEGHNIEEFLKRQNGVRFIINGGFNHYRKYFYDWSHQNFNVGDPVGLVKIREHFFTDYITLQNYGFLVQEDKGMPWNIVDHIEKHQEYKYILGCTPLLILNGKILPLAKESMLPVQNGKINPPSFLGHGLEQHPRTAIGIKDQNIYFILVEANEYQKGCNLFDLQQIGESLGLDSLLNLDGGGSSQFRLYENHNCFIKNHIQLNDQDRKLGHVLVIFDESLKIKLF